MRPFMRKFRLTVLLVAFLLAAAPLAGKEALGQDTYAVQYITTVTGIPYLGYVQGISGFSVPNFSDAGQINISFNNVTINGIYNATYGIGSFRNLGSLAYVNIQPNQVLTPMTYTGLAFSQGNQALIDSYSYAVNLNLKGLQASGLVLLNVMAGSFSNQFTSLSFNVGKNVIPPASPNVFGLTQGNSTIVSLTNQQMQAIAATADNSFKIQGKQNAVATVEGSPNVQGVCAMTVSAGINNLVSHRVEVNIDTK